MNICYGDPLYELSRIADRQHPSLMRPLDGQYYCAVFHIAQ